MKVALITGITGQDGMYLAGLLLSKGYEVHGSSRASSIDDRFLRLRNYLPNITIHFCDLLQQQAVSELVKLVMPDEIYHLASDMDLRVDTETEWETFNINSKSGYNLLKAIKLFNHGCRFYAAGSSVMFGKTDCCPQNEDTPMNPTTPYGIAKVALYHFVKMFREVNGLYACMGILYNHESPYRTLNFLPRKITNTVASIKAGKADMLVLGNVELMRDWTHARDVVDSMWKMLQQEEPRDFVIGSGQLHTIKELLQVAFSEVELNWQDFVVIDSNLFRKVDYNNLCADTKNAREILQWTPQTSFNSMIKEMIQYDRDLINSYD